MLQLAIPSRERLNCIGSSDDIDRWWAGSMATPSVGRSSSISARIVSARMAAFYRAADVMVVTPLRTA